MTQEEINKIALQKYPKSEFWIGSGDTARLYDENAKARLHFIEGIKHCQNHGNK